MIVDREREIDAFQAREYWSLEADLATDADEAVHARYPVGEKQKLVLGDEGLATAAAEACRGATWTVADVNKSERKRSAAPPFITSTLQQEASRKLGFSSKRTMAVAQQLYEGVDLPGEGSVGLITYMRTDSPALSSAAQDDIARLVAERYGPNYVKRTQYKAKAKQAQEAHEDPADRGGPDPRVGRRPPRPGPAPAVRADLAGRGLRRWPRPCTTRPASTSRPAS